MTEQPPTDREVLAEIVRRIVRVAAPERIILFGSAARGETGPGSDLDLPRTRPSAEILRSSG